MSLHRVIRVALALAIGVLAAGRVSAQQAGAIAGKVMQGENGQPLAGAIVAIDELGRETRAAEDGSFRFEGVPPGTYHVGVRAEGYSTRRTEVKVGTGAVELNFAVEFDLHFTEVVSVSPRARPQFESYQPTSVLSGQELTRFLESTVGATVSESPGVALREFGPGPARPVIRGLDGDRVSVLEDGQRMGDLSSQSGDHGVPTNPAAAKRIEVVRGPATLLHGASAIGGLVNVITDQIPTERLNGASGDVTIELASNGGQAGAAADVHVGNGTFAFHFGGSGRRSGDFSTPEGRVDNSQTRLGTGQLGGSWTGQRSYLGASYGYDDTKYGIPVVEDGTVSLTPRRHAFSVRAGGQGLGGWLQSYRATLAVRRYTHAELEGSDIGTTFHNDTLEGELLLSHARAGRLIGSFGGWFLDRGFAAIGEEALAPPVDQTASATFLYEELEWPHATVQFGGRFDHAAYTPRQGLPPRTFNEFSGSVGLLLKPHAANDNLVVALSLARASRYPALEELYYFGPHPGNFAFEIGNAGLGAERGLGFDVSLRGRARRFEGEVTVFRNDIRDYIFRQPTGEVEDAFPVIENVAADSTLFGVEAHGDVKLTDELRAEVTADWVRGELADSGDPLPRIPPARVLAGLRYQKNAFQVGASGSFVGAQNRVFGEEMTTPGYKLLRLFASYSVQRGRVLNTVTARLDNVTDRLYYNHLNYLKDVLPEMGRSFKLVYSMGF
jgi:iron complex outermembrane receptor protein